MINLAEYRQKIKAVLNADDPKQVLRSDFGIDTDKIDAIVEAKAFKSVTQYTNPSSSSSSSPS